MSGSALAESRSGQSTRRQDILDAAEICFGRNGFHRTTMQHIAREAGMTAGNFYHYFSSKEAIVIDLAAREYDRAIHSIASLQETGDQRAVILHVIREYFVILPPEQALLWLDIWAETVRNPVIAASQRGHHSETCAWFVQGFRALSLISDADAEALYHLIDPMMKGILVNRATVPGYDPEPAYEQLCAVMDRALSEAGWKTTNTVVKARETQS